MNHVSIPKDPDSSVQLRPLVCFNEGMRSPWTPRVKFGPGDHQRRQQLFDALAAQQANNIFGNVGQMDARQPLSQAANYLNGLGFLGRP